MIILFFIIVLTNALIHVDKNGYFVDENDQIIIFHGFNVVYKQSPYIPKQDSFNYMESFSEEDCQILQQNGFNFIRLHVSFEGTMPKKGEINFDYLNDIRNIVRMAAKYHIYVLLDAHQDLFNRQFCGNGFPDWAVIKTDFPNPTNLHIRFDQNGYPLLEDCYQQPFVYYYTTNDVGQNFEALWTNSNGLADYYGQFWENVAQFHKNEWNVIGYEIINEPSAGNFQKSIIDFIWPGYANERYLMPFYRKINYYIRKVDKDRLVFFESDFFDIFSYSFDEIIGNDKSKEVFSYHVYCGIEKLNSWICDKLNGIQFYLKMKNVKDLNIGGFLTEFGAVGNDENSIEILDGILNRADYYKQSWSYWQYKGYYDHTTMSSMFEEGLFYQDNTFQDMKLKSLSRTYAYQICAETIEENQYDTFLKQFKLKYISKSNCRTQLFIHNNIFDYICSQCILENINGKYYQIESQQQQYIDLMIQF